MTQNVVVRMAIAHAQTERTGYARNRIFAADDVLNIVNRPFGEVPVLPLHDEG